MIICKKVHRNVNDIRKQIIVFIKKHILILFTHKSIHNSDRKGIKYRMSYPRLNTSSYNQLSPDKVMSRSNLHFLYNCNLIIYTDCGHFNVTLWARNT